MPTSLESFAAQHAPCYVYDQREIEARCRELHRAMPQVEFLYSAKANPFPPLVKAIVAQGFGIDASSAGEVQLAEGCGVTPGDVLFSAPGKTRAAIESSLGKCVLVADSLGELELLDDVARARGMTLDVGVRINPNFGMGPSAAAHPSPSKFGIDEDAFFATGEQIAALSHVRITGMHVHLQSQVLDARTLDRYYEQCWRLAQRINEASFTGSMRFVNFGSGIGTVYDATTQQPLDLDILADTFTRIANENAGTLRARLIIETGRYVVCNAGTYFTRVVDVKRSCNTTYIIVENAMNGFLRPAISALLERNSPGPVPMQEPLYTSKREFSVRVLGADARAETETANVVGNLCTALDVIAEGVKLPKVVPGDVIAISNAGSYAYTLSPLLFASHDAPGQYLWNDEAQ